MTGLLLFLSSFLVSQAGPTERKQRPLGRIVKGFDVSHSQFPFLVSLEYYDVWTDTWISTCGGSIVNTVTVLTACHCATKDEKIHGKIKFIAKPSTRRIVAGTGRWKENSSTKQIARVKRIVTHPKCQNYNSLDRSFLNDVALYFLKDPLVYGPAVLPMRVPGNDMLSSVRYLQKLISDGAWCTTIGWGRTVESVAKQSEKLMGARVQILTAEQCRKRFCRMTFEHCESDFDGHGQFCVASPVASDCFGDSGGPLVCNGFVVGTVSFGDRCLPNLPTVYQGLQPMLEIMALNRVEIDVRRAGFSGLYENETQVSLQEAYSLESDKAVLTELRTIRELLQELLKRSH